MDDLRKGPSATAPDMWEQKDTELRAGIEFYSQKTQNGILSQINGGIWQCQSITPGFPAAFPCFNPSLRFSKILNSILSFQTSSKSLAETPAVICSSDISLRNPIFTSFTYKLPLILRRISILHDP